jgi:DNA-directed RNA polymerase subunit beta'
VLTTAASLLLETLPEDVRSTGPLDKKALGKMLSAIAQKHPQRYGELAGLLKDVGNEAAYHSGSSFTLDDIRPEKGIRDAAFARHQKTLTALTTEALASPDIQRTPAFLARKAAVHGIIEGEVNSAIGATIHERPNGLTSWVASGARGDNNMVRQMTTMTGMNVDVANRLVPGIAKRSFAEGLSPIDFHVHASGARRGVVNTYTSVREPGAFAKELNTITADMLVTAHDCGTRRGRSLGAGDVDVLDRCLADDHEGIGRRNDVVSPEMVAHRHDTVKVRSPLTCEAIEGVCAHCYGPSEEGRIPQVGDHVGIRASQAIVEPLTQLALNSKHTGGVVGAGKTPFQQIMQMMHAPKNFVGAAVLARRPGKVERITPAPAGGQVITVDGLMHYAVPGQTVHVRPGDIVTRGQSLTDGQPHPAEVVALKGMESGREHFADGLKTLYNDAGIRGHGKVFETISRAVLNLGQVLQSGTHPFTPGEMVHWNAIAKHLDAPGTTEFVPMGSAEGRILASGAGVIEPYSTLTGRAINELRHQGIHEAHVYSRDALIVKPLMLGTERAAMHKGDWMANLGFRFIGQTFKENAASGAVTNLNSFNPLPAYAYGATFGQGKDGRY